MASWSIPIDRLAEKVKLDVETVARKVAFDVFSAVVKKSPVDTGRFRANWNVSVGAPNASTSESTSAARSQAEVNKALTLPVGGRTYLSNGLSYALRLEHGWSEQAPLGVVKTTIAEYDIYVQKALAK